MPTQIVTNAKDQLLTGSQGIVTQINAFKNKDNNNTLLLADVAANNLITKLESFAKNLEAVLDAMDERIRICKNDSGISSKLRKVANSETSIEPIKPIAPMLENLIKVQKDMAALKAAAMTAGDSMLVQQVQQISDNFIKELLKKDSILYQLIDALDLGTALSLLAKGLGSVGLNAKFEQKIKRLLKEAKLENLDDPARIKSFFKVVLPELMTEAGKKSLSEDLIEIPELHKKYIDEMKSCLDVSNIAANSTVDNFASDSSVLTPPPSSLLSYYVPMSFGDVFKLGFAAAAYAAMVINNRNNRNTIQPVDELQVSTNNNLPPAPKTLKDVINALQASSNNFASPQDLVDRIILPGNLKQLADALSSLEKQPADEIQKATIQLIVDVKGIQIAGFTRTTEKNVDSIVDAYKTAVESQLKCIEQTKKPYIDQSTAAIIANISRQATLLDFLSVLQKCFNANCPQGLDKLNDQIKGASSHLDKLEDSATAKEIEQEMIEFFINVTTIDIPGKIKKQYVDFAGVQTAFTEKFNPLLLKLHPQERMIVYAIFFGVLGALTGISIIVAVAFITKITGGMLAASILGGLGAGAVTGAVVAYKTSSYKAITNVNSDVITAAENYNKTPSLTL